MKVTYFRAVLTLEEILEQPPDDKGYIRDRTLSIARIEVTAGSPGSAMAQMNEHVGQLAVWHKDLAEAIREVVTKAAASHGATLI